MATVSKEMMQAKLEPALEAVAMAEAGHLREVSHLQSIGKTLREVWEIVGLGEPPEYEPEIRLRRVS